MLSKEIDILKNTKSRYYSVTFNLNTHTVFQIHQVNGFKIDLKNVSVSKNDLKSKQKIQ